MGRKDNIYCFRLNLDLEKIAISMGYSTVSELIRDAVFFYLSRTDKNKNKLVEITARIEELYRRYMKLRRLLGTQKEIERLIKIAEIEKWNIDLRDFLVKLLQEKEGLEKMLIDMYMEEWVKEDVKDDEKDYLEVDA